MERYGGNMMSLHAEPAVVGGGDGPVPPESELSFQTHVMKVCGMKRSPSPPWFWAGLSRNRRDDSRREGAPTPPRHYCIISLSLTFRARRCDAVLWEQQLYSTQMLGACVCCCFMYVRTHARICFHIFGHTWREGEKALDASCASALQTPQSVASSVS